MKIYEVNVKIYIWKEEITNTYNGQNIMITVGTKQKVSSRVMKLLSKTFFGEANWE